MKVLLINGSPNERGCTDTVLREMQKELEQCGVAGEIAHIGCGNIRNCIGCMSCQKTGRCAFADDRLNNILEKACAADGIILGSPVYFASPAGGMIAFLDRLFMASKGRLAFKPAASIVCARRAGTVASLNVLNQYFLNQNMPIVPSQYWAMVHGNTPEEVLQDQEGIQTIQTLAKNMAWLLACLQAGREAGLKLPALPSKLRTNFIRSC